MRELKVESRKLKGREARSELKVESRKLKGREASKFVWVTSFFVLFFVVSLLFCSCSKAFKPVGVQKNKKKKCDCSRWSYNEPPSSPAGTGGSGDADLYIFDVV